MSENKKIINPLLNASVTGGTLEDYSQNAVLLPAAELPPPPILQTSPQTETTNAYQYLTQDINNQQITGDFIDNQLDQPITFDSFVAQSDPILQEQDLTSPQQIEQQQPTLQSVISSFSSYLKLGLKPAEPEEPKPVLSVVDSILNQTPGVANVQPVTFYSPNDSSATQPTAILNPPPAGATNTYRRGGLRRPAYAPIPGLSQATAANQPVQQQSGFTGYQPPIPPINQQLSTGQPQPPLTYSPTISTPPISNLPFSPPLSQTANLPYTPAQPTIPPYQPSQAYQTPLTNPLLPPNQSPKPQSTFTTTIQPPRPQTPIEKFVHPPQTRSPFGVQPPTPQSPFGYPIQISAANSHFTTSIPPPRSQSPFRTSIQPPRPQSPIDKFIQPQASLAFGTQPPNAQAPFAAPIEKSTAHSHFTASIARSQSPFPTPVQPPTPQSPIQSPQTTIPFVAQPSKPLSPFGSPIKISSGQSHFATSIQPSTSLSAFTNPIQSPTKSQSTYTSLPIQTSNLPFAAPPIQSIYAPLAASISQQNIAQSPSQPTVNTANFFQPELSGYASTSHSNITEKQDFYKCPELDRPRTPESPILRPLSQTEIFYGLNTSYSFTYPEENRMSGSLNSDVRHVLNEGEGQVYMYRPVYHHWFFKKELEGKVIWTPFSMLDSLNLDTAYLSTDLTPDKIVPTDGGRYDVNILRRERTSVYWTTPPNEVRRCSWFHKGNTDGRYAPYEENISTRLEEEYRIAHESNTWNRKVELANGDSVIFHGPDVLVLFPPNQAPDAWGNTPNQPRPRVVKRGMDEFHIEEGEPTKVDHLLFMVHGIGSVCDLKFRSVSEVVDEFRSISLQLLQSHYRSSCETGLANRVEVLPISWHEKLHSEDTGVDRKLKGITLESIPRLRDFTNDTILDVLFYTSPVYSQTIISSVGNEMNRIFEIFKQRNPDFNGGVSLGGHSLGSLILFDILCHQHPAADKNSEVSELDDDIISPLKPHPKDRQMSRRISYMMGSIGTGQPQLNYPHLSFNPNHFFALGSPIGMFVTVRGLDTLGEKFALPTCPAFFNIFHPYDPVAYRIESLINPDLAGYKPLLIPHHKGRKRMHLELKETMARVGADLKQKLMDSMKTTWNSFYQFTLFKSQTNTPSLEEEVDKVVEEQLNREQSDIDDTEEATITEPTDLPLGILNKGRRIDYVLQEAPLEFINEYLFALTSHVCYWESEDTMLLMLKEIYSTMNISADNQIPQQTMTIERPPPSPNSSRNGDPMDQYGVDPTLPMLPRTDIGPPPVAGFVRKS